MIINWTFLNIPCRPVAKCEIIIIIIIVKLKITLSENEKKKKKFPHFQLCKPGKHGGNNLYFWILNWNWLIKSEKSTKMAFGGNHY